MIKFSDTYTPEWQEDLYETKLGQLCGYRDRLEYTIIFSRNEHLPGYNLGIFFNDRCGKELFISDNLTAEMLGGYSYSSHKAVLHAMEKTKILERAWEAVYG